MSKTIVNTLLWALSLLLAWAVVTFVTWNTTWFLDTAMGRGFGFLTTLVLTYNAIREQ